MYTFLILCLLGMISEIELAASDEQQETKCLVTEPAEDSDGSKCITENDLESAFKTAEQQLKEIQNLEMKLVKEGRVINLNSRKADLSLFRDIKGDPHIRDKELAQLPFEEATDQLNMRFNLSRDTIDNQLPALNISGAIGRQYEEACENSTVTAICDAQSRYRRIDGQCNNLKNPRWGSAGNCQRRLLPAYYKGASGFRDSVNGEPLPRPREISLNVHNNFNRPTNCVSHMYMFFGQLLDHDIAQTPQSITIDNQAIQCCPPQNETHPQCAPILLSTDDPFYSQFNQTCLNFVRSALCPTCRLGPREQMNGATAFIDASFVYGNSENATRSLRKLDGTGRLRTTPSDVGDLLPQSPDPENDQCSFPESNEICFQAGDSRVNQHTVLTSLQTIFHREHNRIANSFRQVNPSWGEERIFQETRRIVGAQMQAITYKEYLPITLGRDRMSYFNLWIGRSTRYNRTVDSTPTIEFTTAAFRFGHSLINSIVANSPLDDNNRVRLLRNDFVQPFDLYNGVIGPLVRGASNSPAQWFDRHLVPDVTNFLYRIRGDTTGLDLASVNINRGRDHGLPPYVEIVRYCSEGEIIVKTFSDLVKYRLMEHECAKKLSGTYRLAQDIDLWTGILCEIPNEGAVVGTTAACIIGSQLNGMKFGDRFYFEHRNEAGSFTNHQIQELRKTRLSKIICLNTDVQSLPLNAMLFSSRKNPIINCANVQDINLSYWKE